MGDNEPYYDVEITDISKIGDLGTGSLTISVNVGGIEEVSTAEISNQKQDVCLPLTTFEEVRSWQEKYPHPNWANKVIKLQPRSTLCAPGKHVTSGVRLSEWVPLKRSLPNSQPKTLLCHDYKGGYGEDRFVEGSDKYLEYRFFHWAGIDTFVYFSHYMLTIPPLAWINSAHLHGVKVLGTLITEWKDGMATWKKIMETDETIDHFAENLAMISQYFGFEGYLLNVENTLEKSEIPKLERFIVSLREKLVSLVPNGEVIWYDSVTIEGHLKWQNQLNNLNKPFFDVCDGIFLNYNWSEEDLRTSIENAGVRALDIYVGVDVFGRGCLGGGGYNTSLAMEVIRKCGLSAAVFAPGWVHETQPAEHFTSLEYLFWQKVWPYLNIHGPCQLPFETSFCQGHGLKKYKQGVGVHQPWYNLSLQAYQPSVSSDLSETCLHLMVNERLLVPRALVSGCVHHHVGDAFNGGGCLKLQRPNEFTMNLRKQLYYQRLLVCGFSYQGPLLISYATKCLSDEETTFSLVLILEDRAGRYKKLVLQESSPSNTSSSVNDVFLQPLQPDAVVPLLNKWNLKINPYGNNGWKQSFYSVMCSDCTIVEIGVELSGASQPILLGHFRIHPLPYTSPRFEELKRKLESIKNDHHNTVEPL